MQEIDINTHIIEISSDIAGQRIDNFLRFYLKKVPKSMIYRIIRIGAIRVNNNKIQFQYKLRVGDILRIPLVKKVQINAFSIQRADQFHFLKNIIIYEDDDLLVLNKPSGIAVHGGSGLRFGIIEALKMLYPNAQFLALVHRLDRETSGILLVAKNRVSLIHLHEQLRLKKIQKEYLALVCGDWDVNVTTISTYLLKKGSHLEKNKIFIPNIEKRKLSVTHFQIKERFSSIATLLIVRPITGRKHQIRIHTQQVIHPIVGDNIYGNNAYNIIFKKFGINRLFLHASALSFIHPSTKKNFCIHALIDKSLDNSLSLLKNYTKKNNGFLDSIR